MAGGRAEFSHARFVAPPLSPSARRFSENFRPLADLARPEAAQSGATANGAPVRWARCVARARSRRRHQSSEQARAFVRRFSRLRSSTAATKLDWTLSFVAEAPAAAASAGNLSPRGTRCTEPRRDGPQRRRRSSEARGVYINHGRLIGSFTSLAARVGSVFAADVADSRYSTASSRRLAIERGNLLINSIQLCAR